MRSSLGKIDYKVLYAKAVYGDEEKKAVMRSLENGWLAAGELVAEFEKQIAKLFGKRYGLATNSGSSANLLAFEILNLPPGSEVITPACTFATTVATLVQNRLVPVFVDSVPGRYVMDENLVEEAITPKTKAIMTPHLVGGVSDLRVLRDICDRHNLYLIDDSCDTLGITIDGKPSGEYSDMSTTSFYGSHIITAMGFGGMICMDYPSRLVKGKTLRDWGRIGNDSEEFDERFDFKVDGIPYDSKFMYSEIGYNLKMNEAAAAFGLEQLKKLPQFILRRKMVFEMYYNFFKRYEHLFILPRVIDGAETSWLAFPLTFREDDRRLGKHDDRRKEFLRHLHKNGVQVRVLFSGNITRHPAYKNVGRVSGDLVCADHIMKNSFLIGCHQALTVQDVEYVCKVAEEYLS